MPSTTLTARGNLQSWCILRQGNQNEKVWIYRYGTELEKKTVITHIEDGFDFLGSNIRWYKDSLLTKLFKKNYIVIVSKIREIIKKKPSMKQEDLIRKLNPIISGWVNFQKYNVSSQVSERFDFDVWRCLWQWCKRRHPKRAINGSQRNI